MVRRRRMNGCQTANQQVVTPLGSEGAVWRVGQTGGCISREHGPQVARSDF